MKFGPAGAVYRSGKDMTGPFLGRIVIGVCAAMAIAFCPASLVAQGFGSAAVPGFFASFPGKYAPDAGVRTSPVAASCLPTPDRDPLGILGRFGFGYTRISAADFSAGEWHALYFLPVWLRPGTLVAGYAKGTSSTIYHTPEDSSPVLTELRFGGYLVQEVGTGLSVGVTGGYDRLRRSDERITGGRVGALAVAFASPVDALYLRVQYCSTNYLAFFTDARPGVAEMKVEYLHGLSMYRSRLILTWTGYKFRVDDQFYGMRAGVQFTAFDGRVRLQAESGHDGLNGSYGVYQASLNLAF